MRTCSKPVRKSFGFAGCQVVERVAKKPSVIDNGTGANLLEGTFCLRIDADEYSKETFSSYYDLFKEYSSAITIFFNVNSFKDFAFEVLKCKDLGCDVQSHGFYHHTYNDYDSNRYNITKAKDFFTGLGILTQGFAAPMGKWNFPLMKALEDEGYMFSSDFAYDYLGLPSYPQSNGQISSVLEIPVFPVCPELFYQNKAYKASSIVSYYKKAIDEMIACHLPVIIYAHTSIQYRDVPNLLRDIVYYAISEKKLIPRNMTEIAHIWKNKPYNIKKDTENKIPAKEYLGVEIKEPFYDIIKNKIKDYVDFERITPYGELRCDRLKKFLKVCARKAFSNIE